MPIDFQRSDRVADQLQRELSVLIRNRIKDPRMSGMMTIASIDVTRDLSLARIYITILEKSAQDSIEVLNHAAGFLRHELSQIMKLRRVPELRFILDDTLEKSVQLTALIEKAVASDASHSDTSSDSIEDPAADSQRKN